MEDAKIQNEIYTEMKRMQASGLKKTPSHKQKETDIHLWMQYSKAYHNNKTGEWTRPFRDLLHNQCGCQAQAKLITLQDYILLEFCVTHNETSHTGD